MPNSPCYYLSKPGFLNLRTIDIWGQNVIKHIRVLFRELSVTENREGDRDFWDKQQIRMQILLPRKGRREGRLSGSTLDPREV